MSLVSYYSQIEPNLRRTASKGLISLLNQWQLEKLAYKYFGDDEGNYTCPYTGKVISNNEIILEHIIPVYSNGGTVLFNCVPASKEANGLNQKGAKHLIDWWTNSKYWNPDRLKRLVDYMLDGYELVFKEYTVEEVESSYLDIELDEYEELEDDLTIRETIDEEKELLKQARNSKIDSYLGFMLDCVRTLENYGIDTQEIANKLYDLQKKGIFENIEKYQLYQNRMQELIRRIINDENTAYLNYSMNIDINRLINSIDKENIEDVISEIETRLDFINRLLSTNNVSIVDYFESLKDIVNIDILYKPVELLTKIDKNTFVENVKIGIDTKIKIFIEMLNKGNSEILKCRNQEALESYSNIKLSYFWYNNKKKIKEKLFVELKDNPEYELARQLIETFETNNNLDKKISIFIEMLNKGNSEILKRRNQETLEGYPNIKLERFWGLHKEKIKEKLFKKLKDSFEYEIARQTVLEYFGADSYEELDLLLEDRSFRKKASNEISTEEKIRIFIEMLNKGNIEILKSRNQETLEGYPNIKLYYFWHRNKENIIEKLFVELKENSDYDVARNMILTYYNANGYEELNEQLEENSSKKKVSNEISIEEKIKIYIEMLNKGNEKILRQGNQEILEGYPNIKLSYFWQHNKENIIEKFEKLKDDPKYATARQLIEMFEIENNVDKKIPIFIEMLNKGNSEILKTGNQETLEGYPSVVLSAFWRNHKEKIKEKLFAELRDDPKYEPARQTVLRYFKVKSLEELEMKVKFKKKRLKEDKAIKEQLSESIEYLDSKKKIA